MLDTVGTIVLLLSKMATAKAQGGNFFIHDLLYESTHKDGFDERFFEIYLNT